MSTIGRIFRSCTIVSALAVASMARPAVAQVDMNGPWIAQTIFGLYSFQCTMTFTQVGSSLSIAAPCPEIGTVSASGTINPATGEFSASGTAGVLCPSITFTFGIANLDNRSFFVGFVCSSGPNGGFQGALNGFRCGNGVIDAASAEQCDISLTQCCTPLTCQLAPAGTLCSDGNQCTNDTCDGGGTCVSTDRTGSCDDDNECTTPDECSAGVCVGTALPDGSACDDFDTCTTESCQAGICDSTIKPDGAACDDGFDCQSGETCSSGTCQGGAAVVCGACKRCYEGVGCTVEVNSGGHAEDTSASMIQLKKTSVDRTKWKWTSYNAIASTDFGDPTSTTGYEVCVFDPANIDPLTGSGRLLFGAAAPAGNSWKQTSKGYLFTSADKHLKVKLKSGDAGKAKILVRAKGPSYAVEYLPPVDAVEARVRTAEGVTPAISFQAYYGQPTTSTDTKFKAQTPFP